MVHLNLLILLLPSIEGNPFITRFKTEKMAQGATMEEAVVLKVIHL